MSTYLTDEQRTKISFNSPEFDQGSCPATQQVKYVCLECRKKLQENGNDSKNVFDILASSFRKSCPTQSPVSKALHMENYVQAIAMINEGANDFNCVVQPEPTISTSTPSLHIITLFGTNFKTLATCGQLLGPEEQEMLKGTLNDLLYMYRKLKNGNGVNLMLLAAYYATHPEANMPVILDIMENCRLKPENARWQDLDQYVAKIDPPALKKEYDKGGRECFVRDLSRDEL